jgi:hypothetical protein
MDVTGLLQGCYRAVVGERPTKSRTWCYRSVTGVSQECYRSVIGVLQGWFWVTDPLSHAPDVKEVLQQCYRSVIGVSQECNRSVTGVL